MSKLFYDHLILLDELFVEIDTLDLTLQEKQQAKKAVDDLVQHRVITFILDMLPHQHHEEFLTQFHAFPHHIKNLTYLEERTRLDICNEITLLGKHIKSEVRQDIKKHKKK